MAITTAIAGSFKKELMKGQHILTSSTFTITASASNGSAAYNTVSSVSDLCLGMSFTGTNVGSGSIIKSVDSSSTFTASVVTTGAITGGTLTVTNPMASSYKLALYTSSATMDGTTAAYTTTNEASGTNYTAGGSALTFSSSMPSLTSTTAFMDFADLVFSTVSITARGCMIYNSYGGLNRTLGVFDFGADKTATAGDMTIIFPTADSSSAILRLA